MTKECKIGESIHVTYTKEGLEGGVYGILTFSAVPENGKEAPCIFLHEEIITSESSGEYNYKVDETAGKYIKVQLSFKGPDVEAIVAPDYVCITDGTPRTDYYAIYYSLIDLGASGWVEKNGKKYYGNKDGWAATGMKNIDGEVYYFNKLGELQVGWIFYDDRYYVYADENGVIREKNMKGIREIYIPPYVDDLTTNFLIDAGKDLCIKCEPGSFAESFARENCIQYDNGVKRVVSSNITSVDEKVRWIVSNYINEGMTDRQKAEILIKWLKFNSHYDGTHTNYHADGVLLKGYGVCESYAEAFALLLEEAGIENRVLSSHAMNHAWNLLRIDGQWYHCDTTGSDVSNGPDDPVISLDDLFQSFNLYSDEEMKKSLNFKSGYIWNYDSLSADENKVGWITFKGNKYYYDGSTNGGRHIGWLQTVENGPWYYFDETGTMVTGDVVINGEIYSFNSSGQLTGNNGPWNFNGLFFDESYGWHLVVNGQNAFDFTGIYCDKNQGWWLVRDGIVDFNYTGLWNDPHYGWWLIAGGRVALDYNGLYYDSAYGWWLINGGAIAWDYTGLWCDPNYGWWLIGNGTICFDYNGLWNDPNYGWWLIGGGTVCFDYTGLWNDPTYGWWLIAGGQICWDYTGLWCDPNYGWWLIGGGTIAWDYTGLWNDSQFGWWLIGNGTICFDYNGLWNDPNCGWWLINGGTINFGYTGGYDQFGTTWNIVNGQLIF